MYQFDSIFELAESYADFYNMRSSNPDEHVTVEEVLRFAIDLVTASYAKTKWGIDAHIYTVWSYGYVLESTVIAQSTSIKQLIVNRPEYRHEENGDLLWV